MYSKIAWDTFLSYCQILRGSLWRHSERSGLTFVVKPLKRLNFLLKSSNQLINFKNVCDTSSYPLYSSHITFYPNSTLVRQSLEEDYTTVKNKNVTKIGLELVNIDLRVMIKIGADLLSSTRGRS